MSILYAGVYIKNSEQACLYHLGIMFKTIIALFVSTLHCFRCM